MVVRGMTVTVSGLFIVLKQIKEITQGGRIASGSVVIAGNAIFPASGLSVRAI
jgi:hypothetical protein